MKLYSYYLSSAAYRVRIALNLKGVEHELTSIHLRHGDHKKTDYTDLNPQGLVPALGLSGAAEGTVIPQSMTILDYIEEVYPEPPLCPSIRSAGRGCARSPTTSPATSTRSTICGSCNISGTNSARTRTP